MSQIRSSLSRNVYMVNKNNLMTQNFKQKDVTTVLLQLYCEHWPKARYNQILQIYLLCTQWCKRDWCLLRTPWKIQIREMHNLKIQAWDFSAGAVLKNPPANAEHTGSIPSQGISCVPQNWAPLPHILSPWATTTEPPCGNYWSPHSLEPVLCDKRNYCDGKSAHLN